MTKKQITVVVALILIIVTWYLYFDYTGAFKDEPKVDRYLISFEDLKANMKNDSTFSANIRGLLQIDDMLKVNLHPSQTIKYISTKPEIRFIIYNEQDVLINMMLYTKGLDFTEVKERVLEGVQESVKEGLEQYDCSSCADSYTSGYKYKFYDAYDNEIQMRIDYFKIDGRYTVVNYSYIAASIQANKVVDVLSHTLPELYNR